jgi:hypothetical protein
VLPLALLFSVFLSNMSGDWIASKLLWIVLALAYASGQWQQASTHVLPLERAQTRRIGMLEPVRVRAQSSRRR